VANDTAQRVTARIKQLRQALGLSQEAFAERADLKYKHYQAIEAGRKPKVQLPTLIKIADAFKVELRDLFDFDAEPPAMAEDPANYGSKAPSSKSVPKSPKRRSSAK
jgi:transcriptional regulator with XRE-family HTH domain